MPTETAQVVLAALTLVGCIVWLVSLQFLVAAARAGRPESPPADDGTERWPRDWLTGSAEVPGQPASLVKRSAALLAGQASSHLGPLKIVECTDDRLVFEGLGPVAASPSQAHWFRRGELRFTPLGRDRTRIDYVVERAAPRGLLWLGGLFQVAGLIALIVGCWLIYTLVVSSPDPGLRWQTFQMVQAVHFLWPPFLCAALYRRGNRGVQASFEALTHNLPYAGE